jgi:hypothetical protein
MCALTHILKAQSGRRAQCALRGGAYREKQGAHARALSFPSKARPRRRAHFSLLTQFGANVGPRRREPNHG